MTRGQLARARRIVVKVGTSLLAPPAGGVHARRFAELAGDIAALMKQDRRVVLVSSGAVGLGVRRLGLRTRPVAIPEKQAAAAVGQIDLCRRFERAFARHGVPVGQILLTHGGLAERELFLNARHTLHELLEQRIVPLINENDSVATEELRFGDNDRLAALVTNLCGAELLVLLTDIDGLHDRAPSEPGAQRIAAVERVTSRTLALAGGSRSGVGTGGMLTKLEAARMAARFGVPTLIADGRRRRVLRRLLDAEDLGTLVWPARLRLSSRKHWIAFSLKPRGALHLDQGAARAVRQGGRSLLPIGIVAVEGQFGVGDPVRCLDPRGREVARGLTSYTSKDLEIVKGQRSPRISELLGYSNGDEVIHRDDLVML